MLSQKGPEGLIVRGGEGVEVSKNLEISELISITKLNKVAKIVREENSLPRADSRYAVIRCIII